MEGKFIVKTKCGSINAVSPDMKLEQTIQRSKKSTGGIIGQTRQDSYISEWELVYHEVLSISNCYNSLTSAEYSFRETDIHHKLGGNVSNRLNSCVQKVVSFIEARGNPFETAAASKTAQFYNRSMCTKGSISTTIDFFENGKEGYTSFRKERFIEKIKKLSDTIKRVNLMQNINPCLLQLTQH